MPLKIAFIGTRGVPASYSGFETCVEEVGRRLAGKGHKITVYCRKGHYKKSERMESYLGMELKYLPHVSMNALETLSHTFLSLFCSMFRKYDVLMVFNVANGPLLIMPKLFGNKIAINTDGLEWKRGKWGFVAKNYFKLSEKIAPYFSDVIVADSRGIQDYYARKHGAESTYIAYGAENKRSTNPELLDKVGLTPGEYFLQVTRFVPENNPLLTIKGYNELKTNKKLVLIGGVKYESDYTKELYKEAGENVILPGPIFEKDLLREIWTNCYAYIHGNEVGGTNPALLESMACGAPTIAIDVNFSREVLADGGMFYEKSVDGLREKMQWALDNSDKLDSFSKISRSRIEEKYSWDKVADDYEKLFYSIK